MPPNFLQLIIALQSWLLLHVQVENYCTAEQRYLPVASCPANGQPRLLLLLIQPAVPFKNVLQKTIDLHGSKGVHNANRFFEQDSTKLSMRVLIALGQCRKYRNQKICFGHNQHYNLQPGARRYLSYKCLPPVRCQEARRKKWLSRLRA